MKYSVLDLAPVPDNCTPAMALAHSVDLAQHTEALGYTRFWLAEHHNMAGIASAATAVVIGHVAGQTKTIRVGAGGIMLPNHAPLQVAEAFGTLETLYPGRIDLGLGRAPGTDGATAQALRRYSRGADSFPEDVVELLNYLGENNEGVVHAWPGEGTHVPVWILGSSLFGAQLAAYLGLPYGFASHFAPDYLHQAVATYRKEFRPSQWLDAPYVQIGMGVFAADTDAEARFLRSSMQQTFANLRLGRPGKMQPPVQNIEHLIPRNIMQGVNQALACSATGSPATVRAEVQRLTADLQPDEIIFASQIYDHEARKYSYTLARDVMESL